MKKRVGVPPTLSFIHLILRGLSPLFVAPLCRTGKFRGDDSDPPPKRGRHAVAGSWHAYHVIYPPHWVAIAGIDPCGKAKRAQERALEMRRSAG